MYDWSEGGDTEVVVEDIERLNMDYFDKYDKQQQDWRMLKEVRLGLNMIRNLQDVKGGGIRD